MRILYINSNVPIIHSVSSKSSVYIVVELQPTTMSSKRIGEMASRKRKLCDKNKSIDLKTFISIALRVAPQYNGSGASVDFKDCTDIIESILNVQDVKRPTLESDMSEYYMDENKYCVFAKEHTQEEMKVIMHHTITWIIQYLSGKDFKLEFTFGLLMYYLATWERFVNTESFKNCSSMSTSNNKVVTAGGILWEYYKSPFGFQQYLSNCDEQDLEGLKIVHRCKVSISNACFDALKHINEMSLPEYVVEKTCKVDPDYKYIASFNFKRCYLLITNRMLWVIDNGTFSYAPHSIEKELLVEVMWKLEPNDYIVLDVLLATRYTIIDVYNNSLNIDLTADYNSRINAVKNIFGVFKLPTFETADDKANISFIAKPMVEDKPPYVYSKPLSVAAIVAVSNKNVHLGYVGKSDEYLLPTLVVSNSSDFSGPCVPFTTIKSTNEPATQNDDGSFNCKVNGVLYNTINVPTDAYVFSEPVVVEVKESNKLGSIVNQTPSALPPPKMNKDSKHKNDNIYSIVDDLMNQTGREALMNYLKSFQKTSLSQNMISSSMPQDVNSSTSLYTDIPNLIEPKL